MDSVDQISALSKQWGEDPDRCYGRNLGELARELKHRHPKGLFKRKIEDYLSGFHLIFQTEKINPYRHREIAQIADEVCQSLGVPPFKNIYIKHFGDAGMEYMPITHELFLSAASLEFLAPEELKGVIGHETQHSRQHHIGFTERKLILHLDKYLQRLQDIRLPGSTLLRKGFERYLHLRTEKVNQNEFEADRVGAMLTSPGIMISCLVKMLAYDAGNDDLPMTLEERIQNLQEIDEWMQQESPERHLLTPLTSGNFSLTERIQNLRSVSLHDRDIGKI